MGFLEADTVDLITVATGAHWLNRPKFYNEARRVLKQTGVLCFYGYGNVQLDLPEATDIVQKVNCFFLNSGKLLFSKDL